jgi:hypothetical protein
VIAVEYHQTVVAELRSTADPIKAMKHDTWIIEPSKGLFDIIQLSNHVFHPVLRTGGACRLV